MQCGQHEPLIMNQDSVAVQKGRMVHGSGFMDLRFFTGCIVYDCWDTPRVGMCFFVGLSLYI